MKIYEIDWPELSRLGYCGDKVHSGLRLSGEKIKDIEKADAIIVPLSPRETDSLTPALWTKIIEYYGIDERRFVSYDCSDFEFQTDKYPNGMFIRCNLKGWMKRKMPVSIPWSWPVEDFKNCVSIPDGGFKKDVGFHGWLSSNVRVNATDSVRNRFGDEADLACYKEFWGYTERDDPALAKTRREGFVNSMKQCRLQLTPASIHNVYPYRFWEAMSAGRVPVLFCDDYVAPFADKIDYGSCTIRYGVQDSINAGNLIKQWLRDHTDEQIIEMGKRGREYFEKWLFRDKWPDLMTLAVEEKLKSEGLLK